MGALMAGQSGARNPPTPRPKEEVLEQSYQFMEEYYGSLKNSTPEEFRNRINEIQAEVEQKGVYTLTREELHFGTKLGWRNAARCIGRIQWSKLELQDCRHITSTQEMFEALCKHLSWGTNNGNLRSMITVFPPRVPGRKDFRLWNPQLINFAGYVQEDGSVIGDPGRVQFTRVCQRLGWKGKGGRFDILPWVLSAPGEGAKFYEIPDELVLRVPLEHPKYPWFQEMDISWYSLPAVADMLLDIGGLEFPAAPFNGWYMGTEIGARNLCDPQRYNITLEVAEKMGLDTSSPISLWKDTVLVEVNIAVLYSFQKHQVTIMDHHTAAESFMKHLATEQKLRGGCPADWVWIVPPISGSITPVFHQEMYSYNLKPSYEYQEKAWRSYDWPRNNNVQLKFALRSVVRAVLWCTNLKKKFCTNRPEVTILYATETGKSETYAHRLEVVLQSSFNVKVLCMEEYETESLLNEDFVIVVASTFGSGEPPDNGKSFWSSLKKLRSSKEISLKHLKYSVFALGSSQYPMFCKFGKNIDQALNDLGGQRILAVELGDELKGQELTFNQWAHEMYKAACKSCNMELSEHAKLPDMETVQTWVPENFRLSKVEGTEVDLLSGLSKLHNKKLIPLTMLSRAKLQACYSEKQTLLIRLDAREVPSMKYEPGDHIAIFPGNPSHVVEAVLSRLSPSEVAASPDDVLQIETLKDGKWKPLSRLPPTTLRNYLSRYLDITTPPAPRFLQLMAEMAENQWDKYRLKRLSQVTEDYESWKSFRFPDLGELLEEYPSVTLNPTFLLSELPLLQPRYYSISSAQSITPGEVHITLTLVAYRTQGNKGPVHRGVCTSYLDSFPEEDIPCFIRSAPNFRLPNDPSIPIIMVGAGSGVAPFRSFWQQREALVKKNKLQGSSVTFGPIVLFFGCRHSKIDNIYEQETAPLVRKGILSRVFTALSREEGKAKCYVQDELGKQSDLVFSHISQGGHVYVCGDAVMAAGVRDAIDKILSLKGGPDVESLVDDDRYHEDVFGVLHRS